MEITQTKHTNEELHLASKLRPIRLALKVAESLLSRGVSTHDTVSQALDITGRYCKEQVYFDVSSTVITASQYRGPYKDPLTLVVTVRYSAFNNMIVQDLQQLVRDIAKGKLSLDSAIKQYERIEQSNKSYPGWLRTIGNAGMATGFTMLFTSSPINLFFTFITACTVGVIVSKSSSRRIPPFFAQAFAAFTLVILASLFASLSNASFWSLGQVYPSLIAVGGIMVLAAGLSLAATAQDAIDEYYVTASARLVKSAMLTAGITVGVIIGMTLVKELSGVIINTQKSPEPSPYIFQLVGASLAAAAWALHTQSSRAAVAWSAIIAAGGYLIYGTVSPLGVAIASGITSFFIGFSASIIARFWKSPSIAIINSAILFLVPGYMLYRGLMHFVGSPNASDFTSGLMTVVMAITVALAIAAGAALGTYVGRPIRSRIVRLFIKNDYKKRPS